MKLLVGAGLEGGRVGAKSENNEDTQPMYIRGEAMKVVTDFRYLKEVVISFDDITKKVECRIGCALNVWSPMQIYIQG